jgi:protein TonB
VSESVDRLLEQRRARGGWGRRLPGLVAAIALHAALVAAVAFGPQLLAKPPEPFEFTAVQLLPAAALGSPNPAPARPEPAPRQPEPEPEPEPVETPPPAPEEPAEMALPSTAPTPKPVATPKPAATPRAAEGSRGRATEEPPSQQPATGPPGPRGVAGGNPESTLTASLGSIDNPNFTYGYYLDRLVLLIGAQWERPALGGGIQAVVHFRILANGTVQDVELAKSSGYSSFDLAAMRAVQTAAPFPPLPRGYREGELGLNVVFR